MGLPEVTTTKVRKQGSDPLALSLVELKCAFSIITGRSGTWKYVRKAKLTLLPALLYGLGTSEVAFNTQAKAGCDPVKGKSE